MNLMLLAAGEGTRLRPYTLQKPKPAIPFLNVPLAGHALSFLGSTPIDKLVVNTFHLPQKIHELFKTLPHGAKELHFSDEVGEILGNGGGLGKAQKHFIGGGDFVLMNSDEVILPLDAEILQKALAHHKKNKAFATLLVMNHPGVGTQFGGVWADSNYRVNIFGKQGLHATDKGWHFVGVQILSEEVFRYIPQQGASNILYDVVTAAMKDGHLVQAYPFACEWFETGNPKDFAEATEKCLHILTSKEATPAKTSLEKCFQKFLPTMNRLQTRANGTLLSCTNAQVSPSTEIQGFLCVGDSATVSESCKLHNVVVGPGVQVPANSQLRDTIILE